MRAPEAGCDGAPATPVLELALEVAAEDFRHDLGLAGTEAAVIGEATGELIAAGLLEQRRRHTGIAAAAETENDAFPADLRTDGLDGLVEIAAHGPDLAAAAAAVDEVGEEFLAVGRGRDAAEKVVLHEVREVQPVAPLLFFERLHRGGLRRDPDSV